MSYEKGFIEKCAEHGIDHRELIKAAQAAGMLGNNLGAVGMNPGFYGLGGLGINQSGTFAPAGAPAQAGQQQPQQVLRQGINKALQPDPKAANNAAVGITGSPKAKGTGLAGAAQAWQGVGTKV